MSKGAPSMVSACCNAEALSVELVGCRVSDVARCPRVPDCRAAVVVVPIKLLNAVAFRRYIMTQSRCCCIISARRLDAPCGSPPHNNDLIYPREEKKNLITALLCCGSVVSLCCIFPIRWKIKIYFTIKKTVSRNFLLLLLLCVYRWPRTSAATRNGRHRLRDMPSASYPCR